MQEAVISLRCLNDRLHLAALEKSYSQLKLMNAYYSKVFGQPDPDAKRQLGSHPTAPTRRLTSAAGSARTYPGEVRSGA